MKIASNGNSYMEFNMQISAVGVRDSSSDKSISLGTWRAGFDNNLTLLNPEIMTNYTADVVYRIVTVEVDRQQLTILSVLFSFSSKNHSL